MTNESKRVVIVDGGHSLLDPALIKALAERHEQQAEIIGVDLGSPEGDIATTVALRRMESGAHEIVEIKQYPALRPRHGMSAMAMTNLMVAGVTEPEMLKARGLAPGGHKPQAHKTRSKAERDKRRKVKAARSKNRRK